MNIYITRHGQTQWNTDSKVSGRTDIDLTEEGRWQARQLAQGLAEANTQIRNILASPLKRAQDTAAAVAEALQVPVQVDERLIEQCFGDYEGTDYKDPGFTALRRNMALRMPGGAESFFDVAKRSYSLLDEVRKTYAGTDVLLVCHGGVCRVMHSYFENLTNEEFWQFKTENCQWRKYTID